MIHLGDVLKEGRRFGNDIPEKVVLQTPVQRPEFVRRVPGGPRQELDGQTRVVALASEVQPFPEYRFRIVAPLSKHPRDESSGLNELCPEILSGTHDGFPER